jgi:S-adenosylmethionine hydrolase
VSILTDFGRGDPYVGAMKGVILSVFPGARIIDISHEVPKFNIRHAAFVLEESTPYYPRGTMHLVVVDPGVGMERRRIAVATNRSFYVGPDNGVLYLSSKKEGIKSIVSIENEDYMLPHRPSTFEGLGVFSPIAADIARGVDIQELGRPLNGLVELDIPEPRIAEEMLLGEVLYIDGFGNIISNIPHKLLAEAHIELGSSLEISVGERVLDLRLSEAYGEAEPGVPLALIGSSGFLEVAINQGDAALEFGAVEGDVLKASFT